MDDAQAKQILEALVFVSGTPVALKRLAEVLPDLGAAKVRGLIQALNDEYLTSGRAFAIQEVAGGYQFATDQALAPWIRRVFAQPRPDSVTKAALETLAIVAYRQPITKAEIELIRGVDVTGAVETLMERQFVRIVGRKETPGRPYLYGTTAEFLRHFGLRSLEALPSLPGFPAVQAERPHVSAAVAAAESQPSGSSHDAAAQETARANRTT